MIGTAQRIPEHKRAGLWHERISAYTRRARQPVQLDVEGRLTRMVGLTLEAVGCPAAIGGRCMIVNPDHSRIEAEVVGFSGDKLYLMPIGDLQGLAPNARVVPTRHVCEAAVGPGLLGRVLDGTGQPLDGKGPLNAVARVPLTGRSINPLTRRPIREPLDVGVRAINALMSVGRGQRMGLFAGSGVGKSVLLGMMTRYTNADVIVVGLIGERGREVVEFVQNILGDEGMARSVVVATPADTSPLMRMHGAMLATSIAEYFRDQGLQVLLLMDSLTRFAQAQREIGLAVGEPPATRGYPPSVFARIPDLVERAGNSEEGRGSITAFYTVLAEGDDLQDPVADAARAILDGHVVLSRTLAEEGQYPAVDVEASISRAMPAITTPAHRQAAQEIKNLHARYQQNRDLITVGAYAAGSDEDTDRAVARMPAMRRYLQQALDEQVAFDASVAQLDALFNGAAAEARAAPPVPRRILRPAAEAQGSSP